MLHGQQFSFLKIQPPPYLITYLSEKAIQMHWWKPVSVYFFISVGASFPPYFLQMLKFFTIKYLHDK